MSWTETDDDELETSYNRLRVAQRELEGKLKAIMIIITNTAKIKSVKVISLNDKKERITTKLPPKDKWGEYMTDEDRLKTKEKCVTKTNELLGSE